MQMTEEQLLDQEKARKMLERKIIAAEKKAPRASRLFSTGFKKEGAEDLPMFKEKHS
jgi:hypothetical protein